MTAAGVEERPVSTPALSGDQGWLGQDTGLSYRNERGDGGRALVHQGLVFEVLLKPVLAELAPDARHLEAAKGGPGIERTAIDRDLPSAHPARERHRSVAIG